MPLDIASLFPALQSAGYQENASALSASNQAGQIGASGAPGTFSPNPMAQGMGMGMSQTEGIQNAQSADLRNAQAQLMLDQQRQNAPLADAIRQNLMSSEQGQAPFVKEMARKAAEASIAASGASLSESQRKIAVDRQAAIIEAGHLMENDPTKGMDPKVQGEVSKRLKAGGFKEDEIPDYHDQAGREGLIRAAHGAMNHAAWAQSISPQVQSTSISTEGQKKITEMQQFGETYRAGLTTQAQRDVAATQAGATVASSSIQANAPSLDKTMAKLEDRYNAPGGPESMTPEAIAAVAVHHMAATNVAVAGMISTKLKELNDAGLSDAERAKQLGDWMKTMGSILNPQAQQDLKNWEASKAKSTPGNGGGEAPKQPATAKKAMSAQEAIDAGADFDAVKAQAIKNGDPNAKNLRKKQ